MADVQSRKCETDSHTEKKMSESKDIAETGKGMSRAIFVTSVNRNERVCESSEEVRPYID